MKNAGTEFVDQVFSTSGLLSRYLKDYEMREEQRQMSLQILKAYQQEKIALIEAGTGVGKSWAYLVPAIYWAVAHGEQTVISTHTIPLQEQLTEKDIPFLLKALNVDIKAVLVKGMGNYLCLKKLHDPSIDISSLSLEEAEAHSSLKVWAERENNGSYSDVPFTVSEVLWNRVAADRSSCMGAQCPAYKECFFFKARKQMSDAQILIVNHHLLMADLSAKVHAKAREDRSLLPKFFRLVVDEAHHLDEIALESFARRNDKIDLIRWLGRIFSEHHPEKSRCQLFLKDLLALHVKMPSIEMALQTDIPGLKRELTVLIEDLFQKIDFFCQTYLAARGSSEEREVRFRLKAEQLLLPYWQQEIKPLFFQLSSSLQRLASMLGSLRSSCLEIDKTHMEKLSLHLQELEFIAQVLTQKAEELKDFVQSEEDVTRVRWVEMTGFMSNIMLIDAHLNVSEYLKKYLFDPRVSSILCSATLTSAKRFDFVKERMGLSCPSLSSSMNEDMYPSPFDYPNRVLLVGFKDMVLPTHPNFLKEAADAICRVVELSKGSCFVLFTSYEMLRQVYSLVKPRLFRFPLLRQGDASRQSLIEQFKRSEGNVLFATDSFWEGVDVPGEALRCVIIVKLPFKVPSDPICQAFSEMYEKMGKDSFSSYLLPSASIKFKQGFGRLIRKQGDRGCVVCLDKRLMEKSYGKTFLNSIPSCKKAFEEKENAFRLIENFYRSTCVVKK